MTQIKRRDKVAIVGYAPSKDRAPFGNDEFDLWGMNDLWSVLPKNDSGEPARWDAWFELHSDETIATRSRTGDAARRWLAKQEFPIVMLRERGDIPASVAFPLKEVSDALNSGRHYFTSTPAYMIALAIYLGYKEIWVYGIDLLGQDEYAYQRPCAEYWIGIARGSGIQVVLVGSAMCAADHLYGYETHGEGWPDVLKLLDSKLQEHTAALGQKQNEVTFLHGANASLEWCKDMLRHASKGGAIHVPHNWLTPPAHLEFKEFLPENRNE